MRRMIVVGVVLLLAACQRVNQSPASARSAVISKRALQGTLLAPAGLVGLDSATLLGLDSATLIGLDGATLRSAQAQAVKSGALRRLLSASSAPVARVPVVLAWPNGQPLEPRVQTVTDNNGRFSFSVRGDRYMAVALLQDAAKKTVRMRGFTDSRDDKAKLDVNVASTLVLTGLLAEGQERGLAQMPISAYERVLKTAQDALPQVTLPADLGDAAMLQRYRQLQESNQAVFDAVESVRPILQGPKEWFLAIERRESSASQALALGGAGAAAGAQTQPNPTLAPVDSEVPVGSQPQSSAPLQPEKGPMVRTFRLESNFAGSNGCSEWFDTDVSLQMGDQVAVEASGAVKWQPWALVDANPSGHPVLRATEDKLMGCSIPLPGKPLCMLVARVGQAGEVVPIGGRHTFEAKQAGILRFALNDAWTKDNKGHFDLKVTVRPKP